MKPTLLDMTQEILSGLSSDEVNSISDSPEALQVATIIKRKYFDIIHRVDLPEHDQLVQLDPSLDATIPVQMFIPDGVSHLKWLKYYNTNVNDTTASSTQHDVNTDITPSTSWSTTSVTSNSIGFGNKTFTVATVGLPVVIGQAVIAQNGVNSMTGVVLTYIGNQLTINMLSTIGAGTFTSWTISTANSNLIPGYQYVNVLPIEQFIDLTNKFNPGNSNVATFSFTGNVNGYPGSYIFYYRNDRQPQNCCILSNFNVIFDSYDSTQDSTLQTSKTMAMGQIVPFWQMQDSFIPNLTDEQFPLLINEAKELAFYELKQSPHPLAAIEVSRGWSKIQKDKAVINRPTYFDELPNYGRFGRGSGGVPRYFVQRGFDR